MSHHPQMNISITLSHAAVVLGHRWIIHGGRTHQDHREGSSIRTLTEQTLDSTSVASLPIERLIPLGDIWAFNFITFRWELVSDGPRGASQSFDSPGSDGLLFCQHSRWGHQLLIWKNAEEKSKNNRFLVVTGGLSLTPLPLY